MQGNGGAKFDSRQISQPRLRGVHTSQFSVLQERSTCIALNADTGQRQRQLAKHCRSISNFVTAFNKKKLPLHVLANNAAVWMVEDQMTEDGFEVCPPSFVLAGTICILCVYLLTGMQALTEASQPCTCMQSVLHI